MTGRPDDALGRRRGKPVAATGPKRLLDVPTSAFLAGAFGTSLLSVPGVIVDVNEEFCRLLGYRRAELVGLNVLEIIHPDHRSRVTRVQNEMREGTLDSHQGRRTYVRNDGSSLHAATGLTALRDDSGELVAMLKQVQDVSRRTRAERELRESLARQQVVLESLHDGVLVFDADGRIRVANASAARLLGASRHALHARPERAPARLVDEDGVTLGPRSRPFRAALEDAQPSVGLLLRAVPGSGSAFWVRANLQPLTGGHEPYLVVSFTDLSAFEAMERAEREVLTDPLTGLASRQRLTDRLTRLLERSPAERGPHALAYVHVADFAGVNRRHGFAAGDRVLVEVAHRLVEAAGPEDTIARLGGVSFAALLPGAGSLDDARRRGNTLVAGLVDPIRLDGEEVRLQPWLGAIPLEERGRSAAEVLELAAAAARQVEVR